MLLQIIHLYFNKMILQIIQ